MYKKLHHGKEIEKELLDLYNKRKHLLEKSGIPVTFEELKRYYK